MIENKRTVATSVWAMVLMAAVSAQGASTDSTKDKGKPVQKVVQTKAKKKGGAKTARKPANQHPAPVQSPFKACSAIEIYRHENGDFAGKQSGAQVMPKIGFWTQGQIEADEREDALKLTRELASQYRGHLQGNLKYMEALRTCYTSNPVSGCKKNTAIVAKMLSTVPFEMRQELALSRPRYGEDGASMGSDQPAVAINRGLESFSEFLNAPVSDPDLTPEEYERAKATFAREKAEIDEYVNSYFKNRRAAKGQTELDEAFDSSGSMVGPMLYKSKWKEMRALHQMRYRELMYREAPLLAYLPKANWKDGKPAWSDDQIREALDKLIANAREEISRTDRSLRADKLEFDRFYTTVKKNGKASTRLNLERFSKGMLAGERDLLDYVMFTPVVEEVLEGAPRYCGMATGLVEHFNNKEGQDALATLAVMLPVVPVAGVALGAGASVATAGLVTLTAAESGALVGIGLGVGFFAESYRDLKSIRAQVLTKSGADATKEKDTQDFARIEKAEENVVNNAAFLVFNTADGVVVGKYLFNVAKKGFLSKPVANLLTAAGASEREQAQAVYQSMLKLLGREQAMTEEVKLWSELGSKFGLDAATATPELHERWLQATRLFFAREVRTAAELEQVRLAKSIFERLQPDVVRSWPRDEYDGMIRFFDYVMLEVKSSSSTELAALKRGDRATQEKIMDRALLKSGVSSEEERRAMRTCPFK